MAPKVSVIIPVYNVEKYLRECLDSVINQTLKDIEIILVDDGSTDSSLVICNEYAQKDDRIIVLTQQNQGAGSARNLGMEIAQGEYFHFMDSDDTIDEIFYDVLYKNGRKYNSDIIICGINTISKNDSYIEYFDLSKYINRNRFNCFNYKDIKEQLFKRSWNIWNKLYKSDFVKKYNIRYSNARVFQDAPFHFETILKAKRMSFVEAKLYNYNLMSVNSITNSINDTEYVFDVFKIPKLIKKVLLETHTYKKFEQDFYSMIIGQLSYRINKISDEQIKLLFQERSNEFVKNIPEILVSKLNKQAKNIYYKFYNFSYIERNYKQIESIDKKFHIAFASNENYAQHLAVTIASILKNSNEDEKFVFYVLDGGIAEESKYKINQLTNIKDFEIFYITVDTNEFRDCTLSKECPHVSVETFYRYIIPRLFNHLERILYLDVDIVVLKSLAPLWYTEFENTYAVVVKDSTVRANKERCLTLNLENYFNAGVMLINNTKWLNDDICEALFKNTWKLVKENKNLYADQCVLNYTFKDNVKFVSPIYNCQSTIFNQAEWEKIYTSDEYKEATQSPSIVHYTTTKKPWNYDSFHRYSNEYFKYFKMTKFYTKEKTSILCKRIIKRTLQNIFSVKNVEKHKVITFFGLKIKIKLRRGV